MSFNQIKQKINFVEGTKSFIDEKRSILQPGIVNGCTLTAVPYCASFAIFFYYVVENILLLII